MNFSFAHFWVLREYIEIDVGRRLALIWLCAVVPFVVNQRSILSLCAPLVVSPPPPLTLELCSFLDLTQIPYISLVLVIWKQHLLLYLQARMHIWSLAQACFQLLAIYPLLYLVQNVLQIWSVDMWNPIPYSFNFSNE